MKFIFFAEHPFQYLVIVFFLFHFSCFSQNKSVVKIMGIPQMYIRPEMDGDDEMGMGILAGSRWEVFSDRSDNITFTDFNGKTVKGKVWFLEAFYVINQKGDFLHIYSDPKLYENGILSKDACDMGWINKSSVLLWRNCLIEKASKRQIQVMTYGLSDFLNQDSNHSNNSGIVVYNDPLMKVKSPVRTKVKQLYYIFKKEENALLIGERKRIPLDSDPKETIIGWIPIDYSYLLDTRIWISPSDEPAAVEEMKQKNVVPAFFIDEKQALKFKMSLQFEKQYVIWQGKEIEDSTEWTYFPLISEKSDIFKVKIVEDDFKTGYGPARLNGMDYPIFRKLTLIDIADLSSVVSNMNMLIEKAGGTYNREEIKNCLVMLYKNEYRDLNEEVILNMTFSQLFQNLFWIINSEDYMMNYPIRKITDLSLISDKTIESFIQGMKASRQKLFKIANESENGKVSTFISNNSKYFWIDQNYFF